MALSRAARQKYTDKAEKFLERYCETEIAEYAQAPEKGGVTIDLMDLWRFDTDVYDDLLDHPELVNAFEAALVNYDFPAPLPDNPTVRLSNLNEMQVCEVYELRKEKVGRLIGVNGQISQLSSNQIELESAVFECQRCGTVETVDQRGMGDEVQQPSECPGCERQGPYQILHDHENSTHRDFQMLRLEIPPELATEGDGQTLDVLLYDEFVGNLNVGDRVQIYGEVLLEELDGGRFEMVLRAHGFDHTDSDLDAVNVDDHKDAIRELSERDDLYEALVDSLAPHIAGGEHLRRIKLGLMLAAFGTHTRPNGNSQVRGTPHVLLLGDPGVGKSEMLNYLESLVPRSVFASGENATGAGLTSATVRDDFGPGEWTVKAGALPRAHQGVAVVDELDKASEATVNALHTVLEKLTIETSKAGITATLPAETTLLAAGNPKHGRFRRYEPVAEQIDLDPSLMSRFDLMFMMRDDPDPETDETVAKASLGAFQQSAQATRSDTSIEEPLGQSAIGTDLLKAYIAYAREHIQPVLTDTAMEHIMEFYVESRQLNDKSDDPGDVTESAVPVTPRKNGACARLAEASARARLSKEATVEDAKRATMLVRTMLEDVGKDPETGEFDADIVATGSSTSQKERRERLLDIVEEAAQEHDGHGTPRSAVMQTAVAQGLNGDAVDHDINRLSESGELYAPEKNRLDVTR